MPATPITPAATPRRDPFGGRWPFPDHTPMSVHKGGSTDPEKWLWCRKHAGRRYYFGPYLRAHDALVAWQKRWPSILAGTDGQRLGAHSTLLEVASRYLDAQKRKVAAGRLSGDTFETYRRHLRNFIAAAGAETYASSMQPRHFDRVIEAWHGRSPYTLGGAIVTVRQMFNWAKRPANGGLEVPDFGELFAQPSKAQMRRHRGAIKGRAFTRDQCRALLSGAAPDLRAMIWLALNCGFLARELSVMTRSELDLSLARFDSIRPKTGEYRRAALWPETVAAIAPMCRGLKPEALVFTSSTGRPLVYRTERGRRVDSLAQRFARLRARLGIAGGFSWFRTTFRTEVQVASDTHAAKIIMGHVLDDVSEDYVQRFDWSRLERASDSVRWWLLKGWSCPALGPALTRPARAGRPGHAGAQRQD